MENPFSDVTFVRNAILTLYNQGAGNHEANLFLIEFESRDEAWQTLVTLLSEDFLQTQQDISNLQEGVAYFSANILYSKVCKHWKQVSFYIFLLFFYLFVFLHRFIFCAHNCKMLFNLK